eukprot:353284-Chlamydomonas_euryale.AAC.3
MRHGAAVGARMYGPRTCLARTELACLLHLMHECGHLQAAGAFQALGADGVMPPGTGEHACLA